MFCPDCGTKNDFNQSFCRTCGIELKSLQRSLTKLKMVEIDKADWLKKLGVFTIGSFAALIICLLTVAVFSSLHLNIAAALVFMMILFGVSLGFLAVNLFEKHQLKKLKDFKSDEENHFPAYQIERWKTNKKLEEKPFEPIPSVIEETTELIFAEKLKPKTSGELL